MWPFHLLDVFHPNPSANDVPIPKLEHLLIFRTSITETAQQARRISAGFIRYLNSGVLHPR